METLKQIQDHLRALDKEIDCLNDLIYKGTDTIWPLREITRSLEEIKKITEGHTKFLELVSSRTNSIIAEDRQARNRVIYMFLSLIVITLAKVVWNIPYFQNMIGK